MSPRSTSNFCSQCGATLGSGASFCSQCGTAVEPGSERGFGSDVGSDRMSGTGRSSTAFRRRIEDLSVEGWDVKHDYGDRVVMINRGFGSIPLHVLLLLFTSGVGNLLYAWYNYSPGADRVELREDGSEEYMAKDGFSTEWSLRSVASFFIASALGVFTTVFGLLALLTTTDLAGTAFGVTFFLLGLFSLLLAPQHVPGFESPTTFGTVRSTDERTIFEPTVPCTVCSAPVGTGVKRTFSKKRYVAGIPVETANAGVNHYCRSCARGDVRGVEYGSDDQFDFESEVA
ncbi:zinc ribbon domain-containing protein [Haladaptatus caseinilyticus]|uniref:zinc ribbon domain-containing protein n=1 Tax=Haladaptatus caseinilyticus TaxID=2993314 RepID=UPI00224B18A5|nr:zinc ribbon domain-containing protein [Haladaptatus caseinilyticus]